MSSPVALANVFSVRIAAIVLLVTGMALLLSTPFVDVLVIGGGVRWFSAYGVVMAIGLSAAAVAAAGADPVFFFFCAAPGRPGGGDPSPRLRARARPPARNPTPPSYHQPRPLSRPSV